MSTRGTDLTAHPPAAVEPGRRWGLALLLALLAVGTFVLLGAAFWDAVDRDVDDAAFVAIAVHLTAGVVAVSLSLSVGQVEVHRAVGPSTGPRPRPVALLVWATVAGAIAVAATVSGAIAGVAAWILVAFLAGLVGTAATSWLLGHRTRLRSMSQEADALAADIPSTPDLAWTPAVIRRKVRLVVVVGLLSGVAGAVVAIAFLDDLAVAWPAALQVAALGTAITSTVVAYPVQASMAPITRDLSAAERKRVGRRTSGKGEPLEPRLERRAARLAAVSRIAQRFQIVSSSSIVIVSLITLLRFDLSGAFGVVAIVFTVAFVAFLPYVVFDDRRRSRYVASTRELLRSDAARSPDTVSG